MSKKYINLQPFSKEKKKKKKRTVLWVLSAHLIVLFTIFVVFTFKGCSHKPKQTIIQVTLAAPQQSILQVKDVTTEPPKHKSQKKKKKALKKKTKKVPIKKWKALDPNQIIKSGKTVSRQESKAVKKYKYTPIKADHIAQNLRKGMKTIKFNNSFNTNSSILNYYDKVSQYLYSRWHQPDRSSIGNKQPIVNVKIRVDSNGNIKNYSIAKLSGINAMDTSIKNLLNSLTTLPAPPNGAMTIDVSLELEN
jgi:TonB family protein